MLINNMVICLPTWAPKKKVRRQASISGLTNELGKKEECEEEKTLWRAEGSSDNGTAFHFILFSLRWPTAGQRPLPNAAIVAVVCKLLDTWSKSSLDDVMLVANAKCFWSTSLGAFYRHPKHLRSNKCAAKPFFPWIEYPTHSAKYNSRKVLLHTGFVRGRGYTPCWSVAFPRFFFIVLHAYF